MKTSLTSILSVAIAVVLGLSSAQARIVGGVQNKNQNNAKKTPRVYNPQQSQRTANNKSSQSRNQSSNQNNRNRSNNSSNNKANHKKQSSNKSTSRTNPAVSPQRVIPRVNTNVAPVPVRPQVPNRQSNSSKKNSNSNNKNKNNKKSPSKVAAAPAPRVIPRVNTNINPAPSPSRVIPRVNSNSNNRPKPSNFVRNNSTPKPNRNVPARPHVGHTHPQHKDPNYSHARTLGGSTSPSILARNWNTQHYQNSSIWDRARNYDDHDHRQHYHHNFTDSLNYAYRPSAWGNDPWWNQQDRHDYHKGCWDYGWNDRYTHRHSFDNNYYPPGYSRPESSLFSNLAWGLAGWGLGSVAYDTGYNTYSNPYETPPVTYRGMSHSYSEPIAVASASRAPEPAERAEVKEQLSDESMNRAREYFLESNYTSALQMVDEAIAFTPSDPVLHEFRALNLFALGRYQDAAGVLNPILASGPGWDWDTMIGFYASDDVYTRQLRRLENHVEVNPNTADARFLLGYHYMVGGYLPEAREMFDQVTQIEPKDSIAAQLRNLAESSMPVDDVDDPEPAPIASAGLIVEESIEGTWRAVSDDGKTITLQIGTDGKFTWDYEGAAEGSVLSGDWSIDDSGLLVLNDEDVQLAGTIEMEGDNTMRFVLAGTPEGDPGLTFERM